MEGEIPRIFNSVTLYQSLHALLVTGDTINCSKFEEKHKRYVKGRTSILNILEVNSNFIQHTFSLATNSGTAVQKFTAFLAV
jgi:hypothetical protein